MMSSANNPIKYISLENTSLWDQTVCKSPNAHIFHSSAWAKTLFEAYGHSSTLALYRNNNTTLIFPYARISRPLLPDYFVSMPYSDFAGPLSLSNDGFSHLNDLVNLLPDKHIQLRSDARLNESCKPSMFTSYRASLSRSFTDFTAKLPKKSVKYSVRKALKDGFSIREGKRDDVRTFYDLMSRTRKKHGLPTPPLHFYEALYRNLVPKDSALFLFADDKDGTPVASSVFLFFNQHAYYKYNASISLREAATANHLLLWEGIRISSERGCDYIDLGRASNSNKGLIRFKKHWLGDPVPLYYLSISSVNGLSSSSSNTGSVLPVILQHIITSSPYQLSQVVGNLIYRYFS